jgi:glycosyltransferase involved in cell wall biosynthesis
VSIASEQPLVSLMTPVYNGEAYLRQCIASVLAQTYQNWRYLIIDNASTDRTAEIAAEFARLDPRISVQRNAQLVPMVRNFNVALSSGMTSISAKYTKLLMADDWLRPEFLERMVAAAERYPEVGLVCCWAFDGKKVVFDGWPYPATFVDGREVARAHLFDFRDLYVFGSPTTQLMRADLVRDMKASFNEENVIACDFELCMQMLSKTNFSFVHEVLAFTRMHEESWTSATSAMEGGFAGAAYTVLKCGPQFLSAEEFAAVRNEVFSDYYSILARFAVLRPGKEFWQFHETQFRRMGYNLDKWRIARQVIPGLVNRLTDPVRFWRGILKMGYRFILKCVHRVRAMG